MATSRFPLLLLLSLSWIAAAFAGAMGAVGLQHWRGSQPIVTTSLRIVDDRHSDRIRLEVVRGSPVVSLLNESGQDAIQLRVDQLPGSVRSPKLSLSHISLFDSEGQPTVDLMARQHQRGLLAFSSPTVPEGKLLLGYFGTSDDRTDSGMWGMHLRAYRNGQVAERNFGAISVDGNDTKLLWPALVTLHPVK